jgi:hypothetical protein
MTKHNVHEISRQLSALGAPTDERGRTIGYSFGKAAAMLDSLHRKEEREFRKLVKRLQCRKWAKKNPDRVRVRIREWRAKNRERWLALNRESQRRWQEKRRKKRAPLRCECEQCGGAFEVLDRRRSVRFCNHKCASRFWAVKQKKKVARVARAKVLVGAKRVARAA